MLMCVAMLVGTTFAWFTDSVTSGKNKITAGNLDVVLEYWDKTTGEYEEVKSTTSLFDDAALWEPGHTEVAYLKVSNAGTLALKYQLNVNVFDEVVGKTADGKDIKLSDHLVFGVTDKAISSDADLYTRETAIAAAGDVKGLKGYNGDSTALDAKGGANDVDYIAFIIYMPTSVGNEANYLGTDIPTIEMGVELVATQMTEESDFFGTDYDEDATYPAVTIGDKVENSELALKAGDVGVIVPETADKGEYTLNVSNKNISTVNGETFVSYQIDLLKDGVKVTANGTKYTVSIQVGENLDIIKVTHNGNEITYNSYDPATGILTFETESFSPFAVVYVPWAAKVGGTSYHTIDEAIAKWTHNSTLTLLNDVTLSDVITIKSTEHHILNLSKYTMTAASKKHAIEIIACGTGDAERTAITIKADATNPGGIDAGNKSVVYYDYSKGGITGNDRPIIKIENGVFAGSTLGWGTGGIHFKGSAARKCATLNISGGTFNCSIFGTGKSKALISGGTFNCSVGSQGDSTCYRLISGGTFKNFGFMTADAASKFGVGSALSNYNLGVYVDNNGYLVVGGPVITEAGDKFVAHTTNYGGWSSHLKYSSAATNGLYYTSAKEAFADNNKASGVVTVYTDNIDMTDVIYKGTIKISDTLTVTFAEGTTPAWNVASADGVKTVAHSDTVADGVVTRTYTLQ